MIVDDKKEIEETHKNYIAKVEQQWNDFQDLADELDENSIEQEQKEEIINELIGKIKSGQPG